MAGLLCALAFPKKREMGKKRETQSRNLTAFCGRDKGLVWSYKEEKELCLWRERCCKMGTGTAKWGQNEKKIPCWGWLRVLALEKSFPSLMVLWMLIFPILCSFKHAGDQLSHWCDRNGCQGCHQAPELLLLPSLWPLCGFLTPFPPPHSICSLLLHFFFYAQD